MSDMWDTDENTGVQFIFDCRIRKNIVRYRGYQFVADEWYLGRIIEISKMNEGISFDSSDPDLLIRIKELIIVDVVSRWLRK